MTFQHQPFATCQEIRNVIASSMEIIEKFFGRRESELAYLVAISAEGSTFRSYRNTRIYTPSSIFRTWAMASFANGQPMGIALNMLADANNPEATFRTLHNRACDSLNDYWQKQEVDGSGLTYAQVRKLVDLLFKHLPLWCGFDERCRNSLLKHANVPLDKFTLYYIRKIARAHCIRIYANPRMGQVDTNNYGAIQDIIRECVGGSPNLYYDMVAWNRDHPNIIDDLLNPSQETRTRKIQRVTQGLIIKKKDPEETEGNLGHEIPLEFKAPGGRWKSVSGDQDHSQDGP